MDFYLVGVTPPSFKETEKAGEMRIGLPISITDRSQITNLPVDTQFLKGRTTWRNLPSVFLILHDFNYLPRFFSVSDATYVSIGCRPAIRQGNLPHFFLIF